MTTTFQRERVWDLWAEVQALFAEHYREIAVRRDIPLAPDTERYARAEEQGALRCYTVRVDGKLVGYAFFVVGPHLHYKTSKQAVQDLVFVSPSYRRGRLGLNLLRHAEKELIDEGVDAIHHHVKLGHPALKRLLEYDDYVLEEQVLVKRIRRAAQ